jgi:hypothetical protein
LRKLILGVKFADGLEVMPKNADAQPNVAAAGPIRPSPRFGDSSQAGEAGHIMKSLQVSIVQWLQPSIGKRPQLAVRLIAR